MKIYLASTYNKTEESDSVDQRSTSESGRDKTCCCLCGRLLTANEYQICKDCDFQTG